MKPCLLLSGTELHLEQNERTNISTLDIAVIGSPRMYSLGLAVMKPINSKKPNLLGAFDVEFKPKFALRRQ